MKDEFYLIVSRLVSQKRLDVAVKAFNKLGLPLKIIGKGNEENNLKKIAKNNIEFLGYLPDREVAKYFSGCKAVIIPGEEDFNIVAVEAQSFGKPIIAFGQGGVTETVIDGKTGWFFNDLTQESLAATIEKVSNKKIDEIFCKENAKRFSKDRFKREFLEYVRRLEKNN